MIKKLLFVLMLGCCGATVYAQTSTVTPPQREPIVVVPGTPAPVSHDVSNQPAVAVTEVKSPAAPAHYTDQALWALMVSFMLQYLKKSSWFVWLTPQTEKRVQAQIGFIAAFLTAAGIHFAVTGSVLDGGGASITITGLSINAFKDVAWQWTAQQAWYQAVVKGVSVVPIPVVPQVQFSAKPVANSLIEALHKIKQN